MADAPEVGSTGPELHAPKLHLSTPRRELAKDAHLSQNGDIHSCTSPPAPQGKGPVWRQDSQGPRPVCSCAHCSTLPDQVTMSLGTSQSTPGERPSWGKFLSKWLSPLLDASITLSLETSSQAPSLIPLPQGHRLLSTQADEGCPVHMPLLAGLVIQICHPTCLTGEGTRAGRHPALGLGVGEARAQSLAGWCSHHRSRPMWLGSHRSSMVAKAAARNPGSTCSLPTPILSRGTPLSHSLLGKAVPLCSPSHGKKPPCTPCLAVGFGGSTCHLGVPPPREEEKLGVLGFYYPSGMKTRGQDEAKERGSLGPRD